MNSSIKAKKTTSNAATTTKVSKVDKENVKPNLTAKKVVSKTSSTLMKPTSSSSQSAVKKTVTPTAKTTTVKRPLSSTSISTSTAPKRTKTTESKSSTTLKPSTTAKKTTRPAWDIKGRLQDMELITSQLQSQVDSLSNKLIEREGELKKTAETKIELEVGLSTYQKELNESREKNKELMELIDQMTSRHKTEIEALQETKRELELKLESTEIELRIAKDNNYNLKFLNEQNREKINQLENQISQLKMSLESSEMTSEERRQKIESLESIIETQKEKILELEAKSREDEETRRKLHNTIQELKGNIRVFCRVRPYLPKETQSENVKYVFSKYDPTTLEIIHKQNKKDVTGTYDMPDKTLSFKYDKVFSPSSKQSEVFEEISHLVQSSLDGYHTCIFAYGQTGSGKTFTMEGPGPDELNSENEGMISRAVKQIFETSEKLKDKGWVYEMYASFLEIYNETIRDLLDKNSNKKCEIKQDQSNQITVTNLKIVKVDSVEKVRKLLKTASKNRSQAETLMNERSSRSHSVFQLRLKGRNIVSEQEIEGQLNLIDLAGSERLSQSGAKGDRLKETQCINKSLSCLGNVIASLANKDKHVPYRDSKLTYLLQNSLGGNSKTLMFVNISPTEESLNESMNSLRFASKVNACEIGTARKNARIDLSI